MKKKVEMDEYEVEMQEIAEKEIPGIRIPTPMERSAVQKMATRTMAKDTRINIRISSRDLTAIKRKANRYGLPYQTLISSLLHRYASGELEAAKRKR